jgi:hypothetical protein
MNLTEWAACSEETRHHLIGYWRQGDQWHFYEKLAAEAATALKSKLNAIAEVKGVEVGSGDVLPVDDGRICELVLNVCTLLPEPAHLDQVPSHYSGFQVQQMHLGTRREAYLNTWKRLFRELRGWSDEKTLQWAERWRDSLSLYPSQVYHYGAVKIALPTLVDDSIKKLAGDRLRLLEREIFLTITHPKGVASETILHPDVVDDYDWNFVKNRINQLVREFSGTDLP